MKLPEYRPDPDWDIIVAALVGGAISLAGYFILRAVENGTF